MGEPSERATGRAGSTARRRATRAGRAARARLHAPGHPRGGVCPWIIRYMKQLLISESNMHGYPKQLLILALKYPL